MKKQEVLDALEKSRQEFQDAIDGLPDETLEKTGVVGKWSIKDVIVHLSMWEAELVKLLWQANQHQTPTTAQFSRAAVDDTNERWYQQMRTRPLERVLEDYEGVRNQLFRRLEGFQEKDLNDPKLFPWLRNQPLYIWVENDSFGHETEHAEQIREWRKQQGI